MTPETAVALMTGALAVATFWLGWESRKARREARRDEERRILRAALAEQLDNLRAWTSRDPMRGEPAVRGLQGAEPRLASIASLLDRLELQPDLVAYLVAYLIWLTSAVGDHWGRIELSLSSAWGGTEAWTGGPSPLNDTLASQLTDDYAGVVPALGRAAAARMDEALGGTR